MDWNLTFSLFYHLILAYLLALPIGWEREKHVRTAGIRTFPLVAVASCGYMLIGINMLTGSEAQARILYGIITGIGFIGGGAILKNVNMVTGTATAASLWSTGAIGAAVAWNRYEIAILLALFNFLTLRFAPAMKDFVDNKEQPKDQDAL